MDTSVSKHYFQGGYDLQFIEPFHSKYECPICLLCQRDPYQTLCGHRFCWSCLVTWLSEGKTCPEDNTPLNVDEIFPDTIADREIQQILVKCPNTDCKDVFCIGESEEHMRKCTFGCSSSPGIFDSATCPQCGEILEEDVTKSTKKHQELVCPNVKVACSFSLVGCERKIPRKDIQIHLDNSLQQHMKLLSEKFTKFQQIQQAEKVLACSCQNYCEPEEEDSSNSLPLQRDISNGVGIRMSGSNLHSQARLIRELYQKVINLEQNHCQHEIKISQLSSQVEELKLEKEENVSKSLNGEFVWRIKDFESIYGKLRNNHNFVIYSQGFYTSFYGYKVCMRSNLYIANGEEYLGLFVHFMQGDNDDLLEWPWKGTISINMINQRHGNQRNIVESIESVKDSLAFSRPSTMRNSIGFGFQEFVRVNSLYSEGFVLPECDNLTVKAFVKSK